MNFVYDPVNKHDLIFLLKKWVYSELIPTWLKIKICVSVGSLGPCKNYSIWKTFEELPSGPHVLLVITVMCMFSAFIKGMFRSLLGLRTAGLVPDLPRCTLEVCASDTLISLVVESRPAHHSPLRLNSPDSYSSTLWKALSRPFSSKGWLITLSNPEIPFIR